MGTESGAPTPQGFFSTLMIEEGNASPLDPGRQAFVEGKIH